MEAEKKDNDFRSAGDSHGALFGQNCRRAAEGDLRNGFTGSDEPGRTAGIQIREL